MSVRCAVTPLVTGECVLPKDASHYLCRVLRLRSGDTFVAFDPATKAEASAVVVEASGEAAVVTLAGIRAADVVACVPLVLVYGHAKGDKVDAVVRDATELGATLIIIAQTARAVAKVAGDRTGHKVERWRRIAQEAARQCGRGDPPRVEGVLAWKEALEAASAVASARYCLWENAREPLANTLLTHIREQRSLAFVVGPEGGLTDEEVGMAQTMDFAVVSIGRLILRTETVPAAVLGTVRVFGSGT